MHTGFWCIHVDHEGLLGEGVQDVQVYRTCQNWTNKQFLMDVGVDHPYKSLNKSFQGHLNTKMTLTCVNCTSSCLS